MYRGMRWFRSNIKRVSNAALFALAIQIVSSFGHFHGVADQAASTALSGSVQSEFLVANNPTAQVARDAPGPRPASHHHHPGDICAICAVMAMANAVLLATPPLVLLPEALDFSVTAMTTEFVPVLPVRVAFQPRAPPLS